MLVGRNTVLIKGIAARLGITWSLAQVYVKLYTMPHSSPRLSLPTHAHAHVHLPGVGTDRAEPARGPPPRATRVRAAADGSGEKAEAAEFCQVAARRGGFQGVGVDARAGAATSGGECAEGSDVEGEAA